MVATWLLCAHLALASSVENGTTLTYEGHLVAVKADDGDAPKKFTLSAAVRSDAQGNTKLYWTVEERGNGGWSWPDRFGRLEFTDQLQLGEQTSPSLLHVREAGQSVVSLPVPLFAIPEGKTEQGANWEVADQQFNVVSTGRAADRECWKVEVKSSLGWKRTIWVDKQRPVVLKLRERVFIGQGLEHELFFELSKESRLMLDELNQVTNGFDSLADLRDKLRWQPRSTMLTWNDEQLKLLKEASPSLEPLSKLSFAGLIAKAALGDLRSQAGRSNALALFRERAIGRTWDIASLDKIGGGTVTPDDFKDTVTVLHFWDYRDAPLHEPYGQSGFLDYLQRKRNAHGVRVYGVVVYSADGDVSRRQAVQSANRLKAFMNLSYGLLLDDGKILKQLGDPRGAGGALPLFVVIGKDGKIVEYHAGLYEVSRDRGLEELDKIISKAVESRE